MKTKVYLFDVGDCPVYQIGRDHLDLEPIRSFLEKELQQSRKRLLKKISLGLGLTGTSFVIAFFLGFGAASILGVVILSIIIFVLLDKIDSN